MTNGEAERLKKARETAGYGTAAEAARALGVKVSAYVNHENGTRGLSRAAPQYAARLKVRLEWLLTGRGEMRAENSAIPIMGYVGAGAVVDPTDNMADAEFPEEVALPEEAHIAALIVKGDSQWPRFLDGEIVLYDTRSLPPDSLVGQYAIVNTMDGRTLIKIVETGGSPGKWNLRSHNRDIESNVEIMGAQRYLGTLATGSSRPTFNPRRIRKKT